MKKIFAAAGIFASLHCIAQKDSVQANQLNEVVVTATKFPVKQSQTGKVIIVIDKAALEKSEGKTVDEILNEQAGIIVNGALNNLGTNQTIYMRGAASGRTLIMIDGIPVSDPSLINNEFDINLIPVANIERIEICKGAQSTLYGSDAEAGVINIITINPDIATPFNAKATLIGGNYGTYNGNIQVYGKLAKQLLYNIRYTKLHTNGFSSAYDSTGKNNFDKDGYNGDAVTANVDWNATQELTVKSFVQYSRYKTDVDAGAFTDAQDYTSANKNLMLGGGFTYKLSGTTINGNYRYSTTKRNLLEDSTGFQTYYNDKYFGKTQYAEIFANTELGNRFTLLNGADYNNASMNENGLSGTYPLAFSDTSVSETSMYSSLFYSGKCGFNAELGGRLNTHSHYGSNYTYTFNPSFIINNHFKIYASVASGFKAPSLFQLYDVYSGNTDLQPEKSVNYEGGVQFSNDVFNTRVTYFNRKINNGIDFNYITYQYFNIDKEKDQGIEWENKIKLSKIFSFTANYTLLKAKEELQSRVTTADTSYGYALRRPENTVNATLGMQAAKEFYISLSMHYESKRFDIGGYDANFNPLQDVALNSFIIFDAYAEYEPVKNLKLFVDAKNIANKKFFTIYGYNSIPFLISGGATINL